MSTAPSPARPPLTDSPWFWICLFATVALIALAAIGPRYAKRQVLVERNYQGRQRAVENLSGRDPSTPLSTRDDLTVTLKPLLVVMGGVLVVAWCVLWWRHLRPPLTREAAPERGRT